MSISSTLYARVFRKNVVLAGFFLVTCTLRIHGKSCRNGIRTKNLYLKRWWNWHQEKNFIIFLQTGGGISFQSKTLKTVKIPAFFINEKGKVRLRTCFDICGGYGSGVEIYVLGILMGYFLYHLQFPMLTLWVL